MTDAVAPAAPHEMYADDIAAAAGAVAPVAAAARIDTLDFIRGIAVMGILWANIVAFGQPFEAYMYPAAFKTDPGDPGGWLWIVQFILIDGKMRGLFTILFGAGMYLFMEKAWARGATRKLQAWRLLILMAFGMIHFFFIWAGDILFYYALFGLVALGTMMWRVKTQLWVSIAAYMIGTLFYLGLVMPWLIVDTPFGASSPDLLEQRQVLLGEVDSALARGKVPDAAIASGDYAGLVAHRIGEQWSEPWMNAVLFGWETLPLIILGMALYRMGFFSGGVDRRKLVLWGWIGWILGAAASLAIGLVVKSTGFSYYGTLAGFLGLSSLPRLMMALGLAALLVAYSPGWTGWLAERVRAAGRAAFTNYLGTSIVMTLVFHGWALGLYGQLNRPQLYIVVALAWVVMLAWSKPWLERFNYGPLEWLWRCLTYRKVFALKK